MAYVKGEPFVAQFVDSNGNPMVGGYVEFYLYNTTTATPVYTSAAGAGSATSFILNADGKPQTAGGTAVDLYFDDGIIYKIRLKNAAGSYVAPDIGPYYPGGGTGTSSEFTSLEALRASSMDADYVTVLAANEGGSTGRMELYNNGTTGTPTTNGNRFSALAAGTFFNAAGIGYSLVADNHMISPYDFGGLPADADSKTAIELAAQAASVYGKNEWYLPPGTWTVGSVSTWAYSNMSMRGFGKTTSVLKIANSYANQSYLFDCLDVSNCSVFDVGFDGNMGNQDIVDLTDNKQIGFRIRGTSANWTFRRTKFWDWGKDGIYLASTGQKNIDIDSDFENIRRIGVTVIAGENIKVRGHHALGKDSSNMIFNNAVHWEPNVVGDTVSGLDIAVSVRDMQGGVVMYNSAGATQDNIKIHDCIFNTITQRSAVVVYACGATPVVVADNQGKACGYTTSSGVMTDGGGITHENSVIDATNNTWEDCGGYLGTVAADGSSGRGSIYNDNVHLNDRRRAVYWGYVFGATTTGSMRSCQNNTLLSGGGDTANTYPAVEIRNTTSHNGNGDIIKNNQIQTSTTDGYSGGVVIDYDSGSSIVAENPMVGSGTQYTFTNGTPQRAGNPASGSITLTAAATRTITNANVLSTSRVVLVPTNASAANLMAGAKAFYVSARTAGTSFVLSTADGTNAAGTETFDWFLN